MVITEQGHVVGKEGSHVQESEQRILDEDGFEVIDEVVERERNLRPTVEMEVQAKVDTNHPDAKSYGLTLAAEERLEARELEIERTRVRWDRRQDSDRETRCRRTVERISVERRYEFDKRAASVDRWLDPDGADPREQLSREQLAAVNEQTRRIAEKLDGWSRGAISRRLAERVVDGMDLPSAVVDVYEELRTAPGQVIPIETVGAVRRQEVDIAGEISVLWEPSHPKISQVGLIEDNSGRIKFTSWVRSRTPIVCEGERVRFRSVAKNWYEGRCSVALTGRSMIEFLEREWRV